ncbi:MAG: spore coat protein YlbD [Sporolactobacillus sp.]
MSEEKTNDAVQKFKIFLKNHPEIITHVRKNRIKWNDVFDDWVIFGESHEIWKSYGVDVKKVAAEKEKTPEKKGSSVSWDKILGTIDKLDTSQWQERLDTISGALNGIQSFIGQFKQNSADTTTAEQNSEPQQASQQGAGAQPSAARDRRRRPQASQMPGSRPMNRRPFFFRKD